MYTLGDIARKGALHHGSREAVVFEGTRLTYRGLNQRVNRLANALSGLGISRKDRVAILGENSHPYLVAYLAAAKLGVSLCPLNFRLSDPEILHIVNDSESTVFLAGDGYEERAAALKGGLPAVSTWISLEKSASGFLFGEDLMGAASDREPDVSVDENELAAIMYTGGTTGLPKGVMLTHRNFMTAACAMAIISGARPEDSTCFVLPLFHVALWPVLVLLMAGGKVVINRKPDLGEILRLVQDEKCSHVNLVPTIYSWLLNYPDSGRYDLSSLKLMTYAGSPFAPEALKGCIRSFGNVFAQGYGATETAGGPITYLAAEDHDPEGPRARLLASAGKAALCSEVRIADPEGNPLPQGEIGEVMVRGKHVMKGYWKNPQLTSRVLRDGWLALGDMGVMDEEGYLYLKDRKADMIVTGGENVYPKETEDALYGHEAVLECAVVSAPDPSWGERVQAVVVLKPGKTATGEDLIAHCKRLLAGYKCPKSVVFKDSLPKTPIGKILRKDIKKDFWKNRERTIG